VDDGAHKNDCLIDCGSEDAVNFTVKPFLQANGVNRLPRLVLTEGDAKNCGGAETLDSCFGVRELCIGPVRFRSPIYKKAIASFDGLPSRQKTLHRGDTVGGCWHVLWPRDDSNDTKADDSALVLLGNFYGKKVLLLSDLSTTGQNQLLSNGTDLRADIVVTGLPNKDEPLSDALAAAVQPRLIIIADSTFPRRASTKLRDRLAERGVPVVYTSDSGAVKIVMNETGWKYQTAFRPEIMDPQISQISAD
jgi:beta-lactamase superfamily II metal-dependent hydrolase